MNLRFPRAKWLVICVGALLCLIIVILSSLSPREPMANGKPLRFWVDQYDLYYTTQSPETDPKTEEAKTAIKQIGTNAFPILLAMLEKQDSKLKSIILQFRPVRVLVNRNRLPSWFRPASRGNIQAQEVLVMFGPAARDCVPEILRIYRSSKSKDIRLISVCVLAGIGPEAGNAVPDLLSTLTNNLINEDGEVAMYALTSIHSSPHLVVPVMVACLTNAQWSVMAGAVRCLREYGPEARDAIPALESLTNDPVAATRILAVETLAIIKRAGTNGVPAVPK